MAKLLAQPVPRAEFDAVYRRQLGFVWRMLRYHGVPTEVVEDAVQDVFVVVHRRWHEWDRQDSERAWLFGVARRVAAAHRRSAARHQRRVQALPAPAKGSPLDQLVADRQALTALENILTGMSDAHRTVFVLSVLEGLASPEIAELTQTKLNTVYGRLRVAKNQVAEAMLEALGPRSEA